MILILIFQFTPKFNLLNIIGVAQLTGSSATGIYCGRKLGVNFFPKEITLPGFEPQTPWLRVGDSTPRTQRPTQRTHCTKETCVANYKTPHQPGSLHMSLCGKIIYMYHSYWPVPVKRSDTCCYPQLHFRKTTRGSSIYQLTPNLAIF